MECRIPPENVPAYRAVTGTVLRVAETGASELFRWLAWATAIAAVQVVANRTGSVWLSWVPVILSAFVAGRIQWLVGIVHPEKVQPDGAIVVQFQLWRLLLVPLLGWGLTWVIAFKAAGLIAESDLLPPVSNPPPSETSPAERAK